VRSPAIRDDETQEIAPLRSYDNLRSWAEDERQRALLEDHDRTRSHAFLRKGSKRGREMACDQWY